jgi:GGDEF domain-containing protein
VVARIGGDEFAALLEDASEELLGQIRERIRLSTELANRQQPDEVALPISLSMGYALSVGSGNSDARTVPSGRQLYVPGKTESWSECSQQYRADGDENA